MLDSEKRALEAANTIKEFCDRTNNCGNCIFKVMDGRTHCKLLNTAPFDWQLQNIFSDKAVKFAEAMRHIGYDSIMYLGEGSIRVFDGPDEDIRLYHPSIAEEFSCLPKDTAFLLSDIHN